MKETQEQLRSSGDSNIEASESAAKQLDKLNNKMESSIETTTLSPEARAEKARHEALEKAVSVEASGKEKDSNRVSSTPIHRGVISKKELNKSYKQTIKDVQDELPALSRGFSKLIHNRVIEKTSEIAGGTIARPNAILAGSFTAFILTLVIYVTAKTVGYKLSGFETIASFIIGWVLGLTYDYFRLLITGRNPD